MPQVSRIRLDKDIENRMFEIFWQSLSKLKTPREVADFFSDLLTKTEKTMLAKRYAIAILIMRDYNSSEIKETLKISTSTIGTVAGWLKNAKPNTKAILKKHLKSESWSQFLDRLEELTENLPPSPYTNWQRAGKKKWEKTKARAARQALR